MTQKVLYIYDKPETDPIITEAFSSMPEVSLTKHDVHTFSIQQIKDSPSLCILDCSVANAMEIIKPFKNTVPLSFVPIILITNSENICHLDDIFLSGAIDVITYPIQKEHFILRIKIALSKKNVITQYVNRIDEFNRFEDLLNIMDKTPNAISIISCNGDVLWINKGFENMYELSLQQFNDIHKDTYNPAANPYIKDVVEKKTSDSLPVIHEKKWETKTGTKKWIHGSYMPVKNKKTGKIEKIIGIETDISKFKEAENQLEEQNDYLLRVTKSLETTNEILENQRIEIEKERKKVDELLLNILPLPVAKQLKSKGYSKLKSFKMATIMFTDFKGFTNLAEKLTIQDLIQQLNYYFDHFDDITGNHFIEKIKTIGDAYMCAGGLPLSNKSNPIDVVLASLEIQEFANLKMEEQKANNQPLWQVRLGIHTGEIIAGVIGKKKFAYDIWGDSVNTASRMETAGTVGKVNISGSTYEYIKDYFDCTYRGKIEVKHKGELDMYFVNRLKPEYSEDKKGIYPNEKFRKILAGY